MRVTILDCDDWVAVYKDGKLVGQGHSFWPHEILELIGIRFERYWVPDEWAEHNPMPERIDGPLPEDWDRE